MSSEKYKIGGKKYGTKKKDEDKLVDNMDFFWRNDNAVYSSNGVLNNVTEKNGFYYYNKSISSYSKEYEVIFDMNKRTFSIKDNIGVIRIIVSNFQGDLCQCVTIDEGGSCKLKKYWIK